MSRTRATAHPDRVSPSAYADVVDLAAYPIHDLDSEQGRDLVRQCREQLPRSGVCSLPGFLTPAAVAAMVALAGTLADKAWRSDQSHTVYFEDVDPDQPAEHPRAYTVRSAKRGIAYDHVPADAPLRRLYESDDLTEFIRAVLDKPVLYRSADPYDALQITLFEPTDELGWHFDNSEFSVTVMYQQAEVGGDFVYVPGLRSESDQNYEGVARVLLGQDLDSVTTLPSAPGTLAFFHGRNAIHRVTPVAGGVVRLNSVISYGERPDMRLNDLTSQLFYGRTSSRALP